MAFTLPMNSWTMAAPLVRTRRKKVQRSPQLMRGAQVRVRLAEQVCLISAAASAHRVIAERCLSAARLPARRLQAAHQLRHCLGLKLQTKDSRADSEQSQVVCWRIACLQPRSLCNALASCLTTYVLAIRLAATCSTRRAADGSTTAQMAYKFGCTRPDVHRVHVAAGSSGSIQHFTGWRSPGNQSVTKDSILLKMLGA